MSKITKQLSIYNTSTNSWSTPNDIGMDAENVSYKDTNLYDELELADGHIPSSIYSVNGIHGLRYYNDQLQYWTGEIWETISSDDDDILLGDVSGAAAATSGTTATLTWTDPNNVVIDGYTFAEWAGTVVVRKVGSAPSDVSDGTVVVTETTRNQYSSTGYQDTGLSYDVTYYYRFFPYKMSGNVRKYTAGSSVTATLIRTAITTVPSFKSDLTYSGEVQTVTDSSYWNNFDTTQLTIGGEVSETNAGTYNATFTPKEGYMWSDTSLTAKSVSWTIGRQSVTVPVFSDTSLVYNGSSQGLTITPKDTTKVVFANDTAIHAGSYTVTCNLISNNYEWSTGSTTEITQNWTIATKKVTLPTVTGTFTYDTTQKEATISEFSAADIIQTGDTTGANAGTYTVTFNLVNDTGYTDRVWSDTETAVQRTSTWTISPKSVIKPVMGSNLVYNGSLRNAPIGTYDSDEVTVSGDTTGTNAGTYTMYYDLTSTINYVWSDDGTTSQKTDTWTIEKADGYVTVSIDTVELSADVMTATITIMSKSGTATISNSDSSIATSSLSGDTITVTAVENGSITVTVNIAATNNYKATSKNITVNVSLLEIVTFADGTDEEIKAMLDAYYADQITWEEMGWSVGDTRKIHLNAMKAPNPNSSQTWVAQDITIVIVAHDHTNLATAINGHTKACITVQTREVLNNNTSAYDNSGHIYVNGDSSYDTRSTNWSNLYMRTYLNNTVLGAIPSGDFKNAIKQSKHYRHTTFNGTTSEQVTDTLFLPSYPEIFGTASYGYYVATNPVEGTQFAYYTTASNRIKYSNNNGTSTITTQYWWEGSASSYYASGIGYRWCYVNTSGAANDVSGRSACGLAPAFAM